MKNLLIFLACVAFAAIVISGVRSVYRLDPFSRYTREFYEAGLGKNVLRVQNARIRLGKKGVTQGVFKAAQLDIGKNRADWSVQGVSEGELYREGKRVAQFQAQSAVYRERVHLVHAVDARLKFEQGDLRLPVMDWNQVTNVAYSPQPITGKLYDGAFTAQSGEFKAKEGLLTAQSGEWQPRLKENDYRPLLLRWKTLEASDKKREASMTMAFVQDTDQSITAQKAIYDDETERINATGAVKLETSEVVFLASALTADRKTRSIFVQGKASGEIKNGVSTDFGKIEAIENLRKEGDIVTGTKLVTRDLKTNRLMKADKVVYNTKTRDMTAEGSVYLNDDDIEISAEKMVANGKKKSAVITGVKQIVIKPKKDPNAPAPEKDSSEEARQYPTTITCDQVDYYYGKKRVAELKGNVVATQTLKEDRWRKAEADYAYYDRDEEYLIAKGNLHVSDSEGLSVYPLYFRGSTKDGEDKFSADGIDASKENLIPSGSDEEDDNNGDGEAPPPPPAPPTGGGS